jgi:hypothetical protein
VYSSGYRRRGARLSRNPSADNYNDGVGAEDGLGVCLFRVVRGKMAEKKQRMLCDLMWDLGGGVSGGKYVYLGLKRSL